MLRTWSVRLRRQLVDGLGEVAPRAADPFDLGLAAQHALRAHLARDARDLVGERRELVDHRVDRRLELEDLPARVDRDLLAQVAVGHRGRDLGDRADLAREVRRHRVDVLGQVAPRARHVLDLGLAAELALRAHLARDARHLGRERAQLVDHRVDRRLSSRISPRASTVIFWLRSPLRDRRRDLRDVADLVGEVRGHAVDGLGQVAPGAARRPRPRPGRRGLPSVPTSRATRVTSSAKDDSCSTIVLIVVGFSAAISPLASTVILLGQVAVGDRGRDLRDVADLVGEVRRHAVDGLGQVAPRAR